VEWEGVINGKNYTLKLKQRLMQTPAYGALAFF